jgi:hypothetical protein
MQLGSQIRVAILSHAKRDFKERIRNDIDARERTVDIGSSFDCLMILLGAVGLDLTIRSNL